MEYRFALKYRHARSVFVYEGETWAWFIGRGEEEESSGMELKQQRNDNV